MINGSLYLQLEHKLKEVEEFYSSIDVSNSGSIGKDSEKGRHVVGIRKIQQEAARREAVAAKRMQDLMRQFGTIFRQVKLSFHLNWPCHLCLQEGFESFYLIVLISQITQHKCAWPFMHPVNVEGLGLHDYYEVMY